ncbi:hypothetical protein CYMTET_2721 [Cymbomonas tetramitiformis]|uniref:Uncharacterized protein n=1 Tax=Cymbomonas tetramitiformis TaxID=36881 RepID=A0AAE0LLT0_9CHLO|nr:hypothetical protein CYMTET_44604 [Cymbomonas tetramitiformis]KAK3289862.1 hypothetical protein CYMTET_2721 [Cymbomonas tetramitiformis]|eukprot:gene23172-28044_t
MEFVRQVCDEAKFIYDPITALKEQRLSFSIGCRTKKIGKKETKQEFFPVARYTRAMNDTDAEPPEECVIEEPEIAYGNTTNLLKAWKSEVYKSVDNGQTENATPAARKMVFFTDSLVVQEELGTLYLEMYVKPVAQAWHLTSPKDFCNRALAMMEMDGTVVQEADRNNAEVLKTMLSDKQREVLTNSVMSYIKSSAYSFQRTESTGKLDATYVRRKGDEMGIIASLPVSMGYDEKKRKFERRDPDTNILDFGVLEMHSIISQEPLQLEAFAGEKLHTALIHGGRDANNSCLNSDDVRPDDYACVVIKHGSFYFRTETSFAPQKHLRWLTRVSKVAKNGIGSGLKISSILDRMDCVHSVTDSSDVKSDKDDERSSPLHA